MFHKVVAEFRLMQQVLKQCDLLRESGDIVVAS